MRPIGPPPDRAATGPGPHRRADLAPPPFLPRMPEPAAPKPPPTHPFLRSTCPKTNPAPGSKLPLKPRFEELQAAGKTPPSPNDRAGDAYVGRLAAGFKALLAAPIRYPVRSLRVSQMGTAQADSSSSGRIRTPRVRGDDHRSAQRGSPRPPKGELAARAATIATILSGRGQRRARAPARDAGRSGVAPRAVLPRTALTASAPFPAAN
jgi:hypothetical protein